VIKLGSRVLSFFEHLKGFITLIGQVVQDVGRFIRHPMTGTVARDLGQYLPRRLPGARHHGAGRLPDRVVLSYLSAQQLRTFGGDIYLVNILGMSVIRELGPLLAAILVAGRSGSSITAQLGVMRVTEELDAMLVMGISHGFRLIMPKVIALAIGDAAAGGLDRRHGPARRHGLGQGRTGPVGALLHPEAAVAVPVVNYMIGLGKGVPSAC
jgi:phospholipid/cholesterol/gamma-HCH transport system permease protein